MIETKKSNKGVTTIELMVGVAIMGILSLVLPKVFLQFTKHITSTSVNMDVDTDARVTLHNLRQFLQSARRSTIVIDQLPTEAPYSRIQFKNTDGVTMALYKSGYDFMHVVNGSTHTILRDSLKSLCFAYPDLRDDKLITVAVSVRKGKVEPSPSHGYASQVIVMDNP